MATYKDLVGTAVRNNAGNLTTAEKGQVWFDSTNRDFKYLFPNVTSAWRTGGNLNTGRRLAAGAGIQTSSLCFGGDLNPGASALNELYNGTTWTELADLNSARNSLAGLGTSTAALGFGGGSGTTNNESWNGSSWTEVGDLNQGRFGMGSAGLTPAGLGFAGYTPSISPNGNVGYNESWNGSAWTELADLSTGRSYLAGAGQTNTAALATGGDPATAATAANES